jgi:serine/threonine-protein kinase
MELVPGEDLAERLKRGPVPVEDAIPIARQIAEALEEAHEKGIVHRDLKPANVKLAPDGKVKVLDFGLAKAWATDASGETSSADLSQSPTLAHTGTQAGVILGTAAYMSPEQAKGKAVDKRADIWAFGVVLYELLTGERLFSGETVSDTLAAVLTRELDWSALPTTVPRIVRTLLRDCLVRDPKQRLRDIGEARRAIEGIGVGAREPAAVGASPTWRRALPWALLAALTVAFGARTLWTPLRPAAPARPLRLSVSLGAEASLELTDAGPAAILSPDGSLLAFVARRTEGERPQLFLRPLDQLRAAPLPGTEGAHSPFFSPDGQWIALFADGQLKRVAVGGGAAVVLADAPTDRGGTWSEDGTIFFTPGSMPGVGLSRVSSSGGPTEILTRPDAGAGEVTHRWPQALPGGKAVLFTAHRSVGGYEDASIVVQGLPQGPRKVVVQGGYHGRYLRSGHVVYMHEGTLFAVPFDLARLEVTGAAVPVIDELVGFAFTAGAQFAFSNSGTLVYLPGHSAPMLSIQWLDRTGKRSMLRASAAIYRNLRLSPDGTKLVTAVFDGKSSDIWMYEWGRDTMSKLTFDATSGSYPVWAPNGRGIVYTSLRGGQPGNLYWQRTDGTASAQPLTRSKDFQIATSWHPSGRYLAFQEFNQQANLDIMILPIEGDEASGLKPGQPTPFLNSPFNEGAAAFSPNGRWLAYSSNESGRVEVYVRPFPGPGGKWQISSEGGSYPTWSRNGRELFYETLGQRLLVASYEEREGSFRADKPRPWSETRLPDLSGFWTFDLHPDGQRLAVLQEVAEPGGKPAEVVLFENFFGELRRLAPTR